MGDIMESCANCKFCMCVTGENYECMIKKRGSIPDLYILGRVRCIEYKPVKIIL